MQSVRIIKIPQLKAVSSGKITNEKEFDAFDKWWSGIEAKDYITPRDFLWLNEKENYMEWIFAIPLNLSDFGGYEPIDFPGGLYAVATAKTYEADNGEDEKQTKNLIKEWIQNSGCFEASNSGNDTFQRYIMSHVITPKIFKEKMGYHLSDIFVPVVLK